MAFDELRVHGVSGTPPRDLLNTDPITSAKGDDYTKVYRPSDAIHGHDPNVQAFHWGGLTTGNRWTALWIFLSPFALVNVGGWLVRERSLRATTAIRLAAAMLTAVFVSQMVNAVAILELWAYRRAPDEERMVGFLAVVVTLAMVFMVTGWISTQSHFDPLGWKLRVKMLLHPSSTYLQPPSESGDDRNSRRPRTEDDWTDPADPAPGDAWAADRRLWEPHSILHRLRRVNLAVGFSVVSIMVSVAFDHHAAVRVGLGAIGVAALVVIVLTSWRPELAGLTSATAWLSPIAGLAALSVGISVLFVDRPGDLAWSGIEDTIFYLALGFGAAAFAAVGNGKSIGAMAIGGFMGASMGLALVTVLTRALLEPGEAHVSAAAAWVAVWMLRLVLVTVATVAVLSMWKLDVEAESFEACSGASRSDMRDRQLKWRTVIAIRRITHRVGVVFVAAGITAAAAAFADLGLRLVLADQGERGVGVIVRPEWSGVVWWAIVALIALVVATFPLVRIWIVGREAKAVAALAVVVGLLSIPALWSWIKDKVLDVEPWGIEINLLQVADAALAVAVLMPAVFFLRSVTSGWGSGESRRRTGILWDVVSFWPRFFHPLAPPAYGPNAVTELRIETMRAADAADATDSTLTLTAHSQGSMITALALMQMPPDDADRLTRVVTYGSPLGLIYGHLFAEVGLTAIVNDKAGHAGLEWKNLWRNTDFLGGLPVGSGAIVNYEADDIGHAGYECARQFAAIKTGNDVPDSDPGRPCGGC